jgi:hypothetical protein
MAGFEVTLHGRIWVTPEANSDRPRLNAGASGRPDYPLLKLRGACLHAWIVRVSSIGVRDKNEENVRVLSVKCIQKHPTWANWEIWFSFVLLGLVGLRCMVLGAIFPS